MKYITAFFMAWGNFFAVPCPCKLWDNNLRRLQLVFFPLIGVLMGAIWYCLYMGMNYISIPIQLQAIALTIYPFLISGFIHLDGFMDCCDAILSRRELEERQRILKDSHVGAFAVVSVIILFLVLYSAMCAELDTALTENRISFGVLILIPFLSRICSAYGVLKFVPIGHSQYKASYDKSINKGYELILVMFTIVPIALLIYSREIAAVVVAAITMLTHFMMMWNGRKQLGGMSGDIAGYALTISECVGVLALAIL